MNALRIVMRPVNDTTLWICFEFAIEFDRVANLYAGDSRREIDVVGDKQCLSGWKP